MNRVLRSMIIAAACGTCLFTAGTTTIQAQDPYYWRNHWQWHNNVYRPYYYRYYGPNNSTAPPVYSGPYNGYYNNGYYTPGYTYAPGYYGNGVQIGPLRFGWW